jgi:sarcosine oxidase
MTADEDFVLGREGRLVVAAGCSGHAFKFGPLLGDIVADLALGRRHRHRPPALLAVPAGPGHGASRPDRAGFSPSICAGPGTAAVPRVF